MAGERRQRPVAVGILAASLAFRLVALLIPLANVLVAGFGFAGARMSARLGSEDRQDWSALTNSSSRSLVRLVWMTVGLYGLMASITLSTVADLASRNSMPITVPHRAPEPPRPRSG